MEAVAGSQSAISQSSCFKEKEENLQEKTGDWAAAPCCPSVQRAHQPGLCGHPNFTQSVKFP